MKAILLTIFLLMFCLIVNAQPGTLDQSFGSGGKVLTNVDQTRNVTNSVLVQPDGKIVVVGYCTPVDYTGYFTLVRYKEDGSLDSDFGVNGVVTTIINGNEDIAFSGVLQPDGKIIAAGYTWTGTDYDFAMVRYNSDGSKDLTFGTAGIVTTDFYGNHDKSNQILLDPSGDIILVGYTADAAYVDLDMALARYHSDGLLDQTFGTNGLTIIPVTDFAGWDVVRAGALQSDGKILVAGFAEALDPVQSSVNKACVVLRVLANGKLDQTFADLGMFRIAIGEHAIATSVAVSRDNEILLLVETKAKKYNGTTDFALLRLTESGILDGSFGTDGITITAFDNSDDTSYSLILQPDGKMLAAGYTAINNGTTVDFALARYSKDGFLDNTFGNDGKVIIDFQGGLDFGAAIALQNDGKIVLAGAASVGTDFDFGVVRLNNDAALPVSLVGFFAKYMDKDVLLNWKTSSEINSDQFEIQRSADGRTWHLVGEVESVRNASGESNYSFADTMPDLGRQLYRLKMVDHDGSFSYSRSVAINIKHVANQITLKAYPNPTTGKVRLNRVDLLNPEKLQIFDLAGNRMTKFTIHGNELDLTSLASGLYNIILTCPEGKIEDCRILVNR